MTRPPQALPERVQQPDEADDQRGEDGNCKKSVGDATVLDESAGRALEVGEDVDVGRFGGEGHGEGGESGLAIEARTGKGSSGEEVGYGLHDVRFRLARIALKVKGDRQSGLGVQGRTPSVAGGNQQGQSLGDDGDLGGHGAEHFAIGLHAKLAGTRTGSVAGDRLGGDK